MLGAMESIQISFSGVLFVNADNEILLIIETNGSLLCFFFVFFVFCIKDPFSMSYFLCC